MVAYFSGVSVRRQASANKVIVDRAACRLVIVCVRKEWGPGWQKRTTNERDCDRFEYGLVALVPQVNQLGCETRSTLVSMWNVQCGVGIGTAHCNGYCRPRVYCFPYRQSTRITAVSRGVGIVKIWGLRPHLMHRSTELVHTHKQNDGEKEYILSVWRIRSGCTSAWKARGPQLR